MSRRGIRWGAVLLLGSLLAVVGCSNEDSTKTASGSNKSTGSNSSSGQFADLKKISAPSPCTNDPGMSDSQILVGGIAPETGPEALSFGPAEDGVKARFDMANSTNELGSRKIVYKPLDDAGDATRNTETARQLVESEKVFGIVEISDKSGSSAQYLHDKGIPVTGWHVGVPAWSVHPNMFTFRSPAAADQAKEYTTRNPELIKKLGGTKLALVGGNNQSSATFMDRIAKTVKTTNTGEVVYKNTSVPVGSTDFTAVVQRI